MAMAQKLLSFIRGFEIGFKIPFYGDRQFRKHKNLKSAQANLPILKQNIQDKIDLVEVAGPFSDPLFLYLLVSSLGLVPKKAQAEHRIFQHLSFYLSS